MPDTIPARATGSERQKTGSIRAGTFGVCGGHRTEKGKKNQSAGDGFNLTAAMAGSKERTFAGEYRPVLLPAAIWAGAPCGCGV